MIDFSFSSNVHIYIAITLFLVALFYISILKKVRRREFKKGLYMTLFLIKLPRYEKEGSYSTEEIKSFISKMEQFYSNFLQLKKSEFLGNVPSVTFEIASQVGGSDISFYIAVPKKLKNSLNKYVQGIFPGAILEKVPDDYTIFEPNGYEKASYLKLQKHYALPINTYKDLENDPLETITNSLTKITEDEGSSLQVIIRPLGFNLKSRISSIEKLIKEEGHTLSSAVKRIDASILIGLIHFLIDIFSSQKNYEEQKEKKEKESPEVLEAISKKKKTPGFEVNVRLIASARDKEKAEDVLDGLESSFSQFYSNLNGFSFKRLKGKAFNNFIWNYSFRRFSKKEKIILNLEELASIFHFPFSHMQTPYIKWAKTKEAAPPSGLKQFGPIYLGNAAYRGDEKKVYIASKQDRRRHFYTIGQTGVGKSTLLREMIRQDIENGEGVGVIDPHGDLIEDTLANIPKERINDVVLFEPFDTENPAGLNMLEWEYAEQKDFAVSEMISIFMQLFPPEMIGPIFEHYMRNGMLALMADRENPGTLVEIPRIFTDDVFMQKKLEKVTDPMVRSFWEREWKKTVGEDRSKMLGYIVSKVGRFVENEMMRNIIGQKRSSFNLSQIMDNRKIFLVNLTKGLTGEVNSSLLGLILVSKMQMAAMKRITIPQEERKDFYLYIDEFQNFTTESIATILSEARKYRLNLTLANQFMPQLKEEIRNAVVGNVGTIAAYRIGEDDAKFLEPKFAPEFSSFDLSNVDNHQFIIKMIVNGSVGSPFKIKAPYPKEGNREQVNFIKAYSKQKYTKKKEIVEEEMKNSGIF